MGLTPFVAKAPTQNIPPELSFAHCKDIIQDTIELLEQNKRQLRLKVTSDLSNFKYNKNFWHKSTLITNFSNFGIPNDGDFYVGEAILDMQQIYKIHELIKHFRKQGQQSAQNRETAKGDEDEQKQCCICLDQRATTMLPCGHSYCAICTSKYIIQKEEHRCPQCRRLFQGDKSSLNKQFYEVIEQDKMLFQEARNQILQHLAKYSSNTMRILKEQALQVGKH